MAMPGPLRQRARRFLVREVIDKGVVRHPFAVRLVALRRGSVLVVRSDYPVIGIECL